jgi:prophage regulatory protein
MKKSFIPENIPLPAAAPVGTSMQPLPRVIRMPDLLRVYPVGRTTIYKLIKAGKLPRPIALSKRARGWVLSEVEQCIAMLKAEGAGE